MMDKTFPRMPYTPPMNGTVIFFGKGIDPEDALRTALRQPDPAAMREFLMAPPEPPEMHFLSPRGGYPDGRSRRRERRERERQNKRVKKTKKNKNDKTKDYEFHSHACPLSRC